jgi:endoribonuclease Dicer
MLCVIHTNSVFTTQSVADVMEAVLGAAYLTGGVDLSLWTAKRLNIPFLRVDRWSDFNLRPLPSIPEGVEPLAARDLANIQAILKHTFAKPMLLAQALVCLNHFPQIRMHTELQPT